MLHALCARYFYGNGVFRSRFVTVLLGPKASVLSNWLWSLLNAGIQVWRMVCTTCCRSNAILYWFAKGSHALYQLAWCACSCSATMLQRSRWTGSSGGASA